jgi:hypothetical protein
MCHGKALNVPQHGQFLKNIYNSAGRRARLPRKAAEQGQGDAMHMVQYAENCSNSEQIRRNKKNKANGIPTK